MKPLAHSFDTKRDAPLVEEFLRSGYVIRDVEDRAALDALRREVVLSAARLAGLEAPDDDAFLDHFHASMRVDELNTFRLALYHELNDQRWLRPTCFRLARRLIETLVGNELDMQNRVNVSIQMPADRTSLLDVHADVFGGETPYQAVLWLPLVHVWGTKSMFILPRGRSDVVTARLRDFSGMPALFDAIERDVIWLDIPYGKVLIFSPNLLHGNVVNDEATTRWSMNCRFTGLFTPYSSAEKALGSYYLPITVRPVTKIGMAYRQPSGFEE
jgi:sporadic carbohydrate cluster 2OG-Fe(II) oxygenase